MGQLALQCRNRQVRPRTGQEQHPRHVRLPATGRHDYRLYLYRPSENNARDSKPPLVCWAVDEIFTHTGDTAFVAEMYPQLLSYYKWWYEKRDHNRNGMCEYGATDGTLEAAAWESGMDNAIRFDGAVMLKNEGYEDAWSMDQESVDLNAYLALECKLLKKFSSLLKIPFDAPDYSSQVADYFFDKNINFFCDRRLKDGSFIEEPGCEAYTPLWTRIATQRKWTACCPYFKIRQSSPRISPSLPLPPTIPNTIRAATGVAPSGWTKPTLPSADCATTATTSCR